MEGLIDLGTVMARELAFMARAVPLQLLRVPVRTAQRILQKRRPA